MAVPIFRQAALGASNAMPRIWLGSGPVCGMKFLAAVTSSTNGLGGRAIVCGVQDVGLSRELHREALGVYITRFIAIEWLAREFSHKWACCNAPRRFT